MARRRREKLQAFARSRVNLDANCRGLVGRAIPRSGRRVARYGLRNRGEVLKVDAYGSVGWDNTVVCARFEPSLGRLPVETGLGADAAARHSLR